MSPEYKIYIDEDGKWTATTTKFPSRSRGDSPQEALEKILEFERQVDDINKHVDGECSPKCEQCIKERESLF